MPQTSDFVKKLHRMLESPDYRDIVSWGPKGDCFIVKDTNEFTKKVLPKLFKHQNFASFVRQLNKYDFHKIKHSDDDNEEEEAWWMFKHPNFRANNKAAMENIRRKSQRPAPPLASYAAAPNSYHFPPSQDQEELRIEVEDLRQTVDDMKMRMAELESRVTAHLGSTSQFSTSQLSRAPSISSTRGETPPAFIEEVPPSQSILGTSSSAPAEFFDSKSNVTTNSFPYPSPGQAPSPNNMIARNPSLSQPRRIPRVLLVDDDPVARKLSSKFLERYGCMIDVAIDGVDAINKINAAKYDLVLMDIVMPKLDGLSATAIIRKFDKSTPIMAMTGNSRPDEIVTYCTSGMNDVLSKPFTRKGLYYMLEKYLQPPAHADRQQDINLPQTPTFDMPPSSMSPTGPSASSVHDYNSYGGNTNPTSNFSAMAGDLASVGFGFFDDSNPLFNDGSFGANPVKDSASHCTSPHDQHYRPSPQHQQQQQHHQQQHQQLPHAMSGRPHQSSSDLDAMLMSLSSPSLDDPRLMHPDSQHKRKREEDINILNQDDPDGKRRRLGMEPVSAQ